MDLPQAAQISFLSVVSMSAPQEQRKWNRGSTPLSDVIASSTPTLGFTAYTPLVITAGQNLGLDPSGFRRGLSVLTG
jgi:hypothetical protein